MIKILEPEDARHLQAAADMFPKKFTIPYNLACYETQLVNPSKTIGQVPAPNFERFPVCRILLLNLYVTRF